MIKCLIILLIWTYGTNAQVPGLGHCPKINSVQTNFDLNKYLGKWYEAEKYFSFFEIGGRCNSATYSLNEDGTVKVFNEELNSITGSQTSIEGVARFAGAAKDAKLLVRFPSVPVQFGEVPYWILETDYDSYAVIWSCTELPIISTKFAWILTREQNPSPEVLQKAYGVFDRFNLDKGALEKTDHKDCPKN
ncbi:hypothetical protein HHI36_000841 [Cryptolaemus montrouzieri]|uniref:Lipocalin/cytosolic fatty-acid binding domain-containing protein n=1 Tax=Cryptolaemus montrouzieri TaxID=559131 RepID=A0ABD2P5Q5_9CUCU